MMSPRLSLDDHRALGAKLKGMRSELMALSATVRRTYPKNSREVRSLNTAIRRLDRTRSMLDDTVFRDFACEDAGAIYYGD
ncbi:hypothetical protein U8607_06525 [Methylobacterium durans]|uniref:hypothetical protein n=1 Tax=Methylobacterium durans TaxID=2202825 RepID=UPI002AFFDFC9|nr:hypothetical protein [Methylobacterium durans]MEA1831736.1 hypothetical protein [Methylobacterium durans]